MEDLLSKINKDNQEIKKMLSEILSILYSIDCEDRKLKDLAINFGVGICSNIVGDRLLGLGN